MRKVSSASKICLLLRSSIEDLYSESKVTILIAQGHEFLSENLQFRIAERQAQDFEESNGSETETLDRSSGRNLSRPRAGLEQQFCHAESSSGFWALQAVVRQWRNNGNSGQSAMISQTDDARSRHMGVCFHELWLAGIQRLSSYPDFKRGRSGAPPPAANPHRSESKILLCKIEKTDIMHSL